MTTILHIDSSAKTQGSATRTLTADAVRVLQQKDPATKVIYRDLTKDPLPHISAEYLGGIFGAAGLADHETVKLSDTLLGELNMADILVIGAPMYNFSIPSQLKAWIDYVLRAGKTFRYTADGKPEGLIHGKRAIIAVASGGVYSEGPMVPFDHVGPLLQQALGFIGITDSTVIRAEKQAFGPEAAAQEVEQAKKAIEAKAA